MRRLGRAESPVVEQTFRKRETLKSSKQGLAWGWINLIMALAMYVEVVYRSVSHYLNLAYPVVWYAECGLAGLFTLNTLVDFARYLGWSIFVNAPVEMNAQQKRLLGVRDSDIGFRTVTRSSPPAGSVVSTGPVYTPSAFSSRSPLAGGGSPSTPPHHAGNPSHLTPSPPHMGHSPGHLTPPSGLLTPSPQHLSHASSHLSPSPSHMTQTPSFLMSQSMHSSFTSLSQANANSPLSYNLSPLFRETLDTSGLRSRLSSAQLRASPLSKEDKISDLTALDHFLKEQEEKDYRAQLGSADNSPSGSPSFWNYNRTATDYTPILRKYQYQIACRSPASPLSRTDDDDPDNPNTYRGPEVWSRLDVYREDLDFWTENLRKWLSQTIMARLVNEINQTNKALRRIGCEDMEIGEVSISTLKQLAVTKGQYVPALNHVISFLDVTTNQEYLVQRVRELGEGGCMSDFRWNGGGQHKGKAWGEHLPTDSMIVMHMLCTYMDLRLPPHPKYPDGKTFTSQHFMKTPDKPNIEKKDNLLLFQSKIHAPHYKIILGEDTWDLPRGRNNMFHAIIFFLHHIKTKEAGMLGRVNLGLSGINILWVLDKRK